MPRLLQVRELLLLAVPLTMTYIHLGTVAFDQYLFRDLGGLGVWEGSGASLDADYTTLMNYLAIIIGGGWVEGDGELIFYACNMQACVAVLEFW
jgi:hypothetical protein